MIAIGDRDINAFAISRGAPLDASERSSWTNWRAPDDAAVIRIERPKNAALLTKTDNVSHEIRSCSSEVKIWAAGYRTVRVWNGGSFAGYGPSVRALQLL